MQIIRIISLPKHYRPGSVDDIMALQDRYEVKMSILKPVESTQKISIVGQKLGDIRETEQNLLEIVSDREIIQVDLMFVGAENQELFAIKICYLLKEFIC